MRRLIPLVALALVLPSSAFAALSLRVTSDREAKVFIGSEFIGTTPLTVNAIKQGTHSLRVEDIATGEVKTFSVTSPRSASTEKAIHADFSGAGQADGDAPLTSAIERLRASRQSRPYGGYNAAGSLYDPYRASGYSQEASIYGQPYVAPAPQVYAPPAGYYSSGYPAPSYPAPVYSSYYGGAYGTPGFASTYAAPSYYGNGCAPSYRRRDNSSNNFRNVLLGAGLVNEVFNNGGRSRNSIRRAVVGAGLLNELTRGSRGSGFGGGYGGGFGGGYGGGSFFGF